MKITLSIAGILCRAPLWAATGLFAIALSGLPSCSTDVGPSTSGQGVIALFNPGATPPVVPTPTDLVRVGGSLQIPLDPAEATNGALATFNNYLRSLDGFPPDSTASTSFMGAIDPTSLAEGVVVFDATAQKLLAPPAAVPSLDPVVNGTQRLVISTQNRWVTGHTYLVGLLSWQQSADVHGLRSTDGKIVISDTAFAYLRSQTPIYAKCQDSANAACACTDLGDPTCHSVVDGLADSQAQQLEAGRLGIKPSIDAMLMTTGRVRSDLVMAFSFTISKRPFATFDVGRNQAPFPSNFLLSNQGLDKDPQANATVNLPTLASDDAKTQALKGGLNTLDGFSTTGSVQFPIDAAYNGAAPVDMDASTVIPGKSAFLLNVSAANMPTFTAQPLEALLDPVGQVSGFAGQIWVTPKRPLDGDRTTYAAVLTTSIKDKNGQPLTPAPTTLLLTQSSPLMTADGKSAVPVLSLAQAQQLEPLRLALAPLITQLGTAGIKPSTIAAVTAYRTQAIIKPLQQLLGAIGALTSVIPSDVTNLSVTYTGLPASLGHVSAVIHGTLSVLRVVDLRGPFNLARLAGHSANDQIPFMMTVPLKALAPAGGAPVIIAQHGLTRWRGDTLAIADSLASQGLAMIAIDVIYHGARVVCLADKDCNGVTCTQPSPVGGVPQAGTCVNNAYLPALGAVASLPGSTDVIPDASLPNRDFTNLVNPFAQRDNFRQHMLDLFQLVRVIKDASPTGITMQLAGMATSIPLPTLAALDPTKIGYVGQSLGSILGTNFLAMNPDVNLGVLSVGGGDVVGIFTDPASSLSAGLAGALGVIPGTPAFYSLVESFRWIMDPADPINLARYVRSPSAVLMPGRKAAKVILQESGMDTVIPNPYTLALGIELGLPLDANQHLEGIDQEGGTTPVNKSTFFAGADHGVLFDFTVPALTLQAQAQAAVYLATGLAGYPSVQ